MTLNILATVTVFLCRS